MTDPLVATIKEEIEAQSAESNSGLYFEDWGTEGVQIDGDIDLNKIAAAVRAQFRLTPVERSIP